jgi:uncharacterized protein (DUF362 family)/NAD-dependent dihydropyrimidine dehydrogenase PreA subunit
MHKEKVALADAVSYDSEEIYNAVKKACREINFKFKRNKTVLIKPNILAQNRPEQHSITHFSVIEALCRILKEENCRIQIGESIAFYQKGLTEKAFITSGIKDVSEKYGAELLPFEKEPMIKIKKGLSILNEIYIPEKLLNADLVINACKLKTHSGLRLSGAVKNMFGCLPGGYKQKIHILAKNDFELSDVFLDICGIVKPELNIMDAVTGLDGGPTALGKPRKAGRIIASKSPVALDITASRMIGYIPEDIPFLIRAKERGIINNYDDIEVIGEVPSLKFKSLIKYPVKTEKGKDGMFVTDTFVNPYIIKSRCSSCMKCISMCPVNAIQKKAYPLIDDEKCINCYYCLSECPDNAIGIRSSLKNKFINAARFILDI